MNTEELLKRKRELENELELINLSIKNEDWLSGRIYVHRSIRDNEPYLLIGNANNEDGVTLNLDEMCKLVDYINKITKQ